jgi:hypothetical protein
MNRADSKKPFYKIEVTSYDGKRRAALTENIQRLITSVEIQETTTTGESDGANQLTVNFAQTHYLPEDGGLRPQADRVFGEITNRPNAILDLRFDSEKGFTFVSKDELDGERTNRTRTQNGKQEPIVFLFQEQNIIDITWGYLEPYAARTRKFKITSVEAIGDSTNDGKIKLVCTDISMQATQTSPNNGVIFQDETSGKTETLSLKQTLFKVADAFNLTLIYDEDKIDSYPPRAESFDKNRTFKGDTLPSDKAFRLPRGMTYRQFIDQLASEFQSRVEYDTDEKGNELVRFTKIEKLFEKPIETFFYKNPNGLMKSYKLTALDRYGITKTSVGSLEKEKELYVTTQVTESNKKVAQVFDGDAETKIQDTLGTKSSGFSETRPRPDEKNTEQAIDNTAESVSNSMIYNTTIEVNSVGHPDFRPRAYNIQNIGARYSGNYRMLTVTHVIGLNGYECKMVGNRNDVSDGGVEAATYEGKQQTVNTQVTVPIEE